MEDHTYNHNEYMEILIAPNPSEKTIHFKNIFITADKSFPPNHSFPYEEMIIENCIIFDDRKTWEWFFGPKSCLRRITYKTDKSSIFKDPASIFAEAAYKYMAENYKIQKIELITPFNDFKFGKYIDRNIKGYKNCSRSVIYFILACKNKENLLGRIFPKDIVIYIAKFLWSTRGSIEWVMQPYVDEIKNMVGKGEEKHYFYDMSRTQRKYIHEYVEKNFPNYISRSEYMAHGLERDCEYCKTYHKSTNYGESWNGGEINCPKSDWSYSVDYEDIEYLYDEPIRLSDFRPTGEMIICKKGHPYKKKSHKYPYSYRKKY